MHSYMINLTNSYDVVASSISLIENNQTVDVKDFVFSKINAAQLATRILIDNIELKPVTTGAT